MTQHTLDLKSAGVPLEQGTKVLVAIHGRGGSAADILQLAMELADEEFTLLAPQAGNRTWYPYSFLAPPAQNEPGLSSAIDVINELVNKVVANGIIYKNIHFMGFSQGACLTLEYVTRRARRYGSVIAFTGGLIGDKIYPENYSGDFDGTPVYIGSSDIDPHVPLQRIYASENIIRDMGGDIKVDVFHGMGHTVNRQELETGRHLVNKVAM